MRAVAPDQNDRQWSALAKDTWQDETVWVMISVIAESLYQALF